MNEINFLADHPEAVPTLTSWFVAQWPDYFANRSEADVAQDFHAEANCQKIPIRLLAWIDSELAGTLTLRGRAIDSLDGYGPGIGGLYVAERYRERGIGTDLVRAGMELALDLGYDRLYAATMAARGIFDRLGWQQIRTFTHNGEVQVLYQYSIASTR